MIKDHLKLVFDIKVETPKGMLFCMYIKWKTEIGGVRQMQNHVYHLAGT